MLFKTVLLAILPALALADEVTTEYTLTHECKRQTQRGDSIKVHYSGTLASDGSKFDASYDRGQPLSFTVGKGQVIKGWDEGLLDMCPGDKRKLTIPPEFGYGQRAMGPIPAGSTLIFETELVEIVGAEKEDKVVKGSGTEAQEPEVEEPPAAETETAVEAEETKKDEL